MIETEQKPTLTKLETQVLDRLRDGRPHGIPLAKVDQVLASLEAKGFGDEL